MTGSSLFQNELVKIALTHRKLGCKKHTVYFPKKIERSYGLNSIINVETIQIGQIHLPLPMPEKEYHIVTIGAIPLKVEVTLSFSEMQSFVS